MGDSVFRIVCFLGNALKLFVGIQSVHLFVYYLHYVFNILMYPLLILLEITTYLFLCLHYLLTIFIYPLF